MYSFFLTFLAALEFAQLAPLLSALLGGGILGGVVAWRKAGAEKDSIAATASKTAIEVFQASIRQLQGELQAANKEAEGLAQDLHDARSNLAAIMQERGALSAEVTVLRNRVQVLEALAAGRGTQQ